MPNPMKYDSWTLRDEMHFIDRIAAHYGRDRKPRLPNASRCLVGYLYGLQIRVRGFDGPEPISEMLRERLTDYATGCLEKLRR